MSTSRVLTTFYFARCSFFLLLRFADASVFSPSPYFAFLFISPKFARLSHTVDKVLLIVRKSQPSAKTKQQQQPTEHTNIVGVASRWL
jgi:hypothetical protein